ncbi:ATP cone domain-containing protein [Flavihumibacter fluvii]|uniref:ATP cone domain-containing protein n=1 Tax=Flavihumibacter fluvii TaxID=2838157 RepID=UPI001BDDDF97|nr:ATP cone domain-containing protein [Flavihumibacter fluvii]ULQ52201.1 ATP cone domain-containing protein [Flavihumibacter fluvii]
MNSNDLIITKASGLKAPFSEEKLKQSLRRSGATGMVIDAIAEEVKKQLYTGMPTKKIYKLAYALLKKQSKPVAAKYKLKVAIMELGPSGYPFEKFFAALLKNNGFTVKVGEIINGHCVKHEIDVIAEKDDKLFMIECKYHHAQGIICNVKIPLYVAARFRDVDTEWSKDPGNETKFRQGWLVTNTRFSTDAVQYGTCAGLHLVGWNYPAKESLNNLVEKTGLYPLTCLNSITKKEKQLLLEQNIVLCREICNNPELLKLAHISESRFNTILGEGQTLCKGDKAD